MRTGLRHDRATHRTTSKLGLLLLLPAVAVGCSDQSLPTASSTSPASAPVLSAGANPVVLSASGSGQVLGPLPGGSEAGWRTFSFTANQRADGRTTGHLQYNTHDQGDMSQVTHKQFGRVFCMTDAGNGFVAVGVEGTKRTPDDDPPNGLAGFGVPDAVRPDNHGMFFVVKDNGEGANAAPDQITAVSHTTLEFVGGLCAAGPAHPLAGAIPLFVSDIEAGNIQVND